MSLYYLSPTPASDFLPQSLCKSLFLSSRIYPCLVLSHLSPILMLVCILYFFNSEAWISLAQLWNLCWNNIHLSPIIFQLLRLCRENTKLKTKRAILNIAITKLQTKTHSNWLYHNKMEYSSWQYFNFNITNHVKIVMAKTRRLKHTILCQHIDKLNDVSPIPHQCFLKLFPKMKENGTDVLVIMPMGSLMKQRLALLSGPAHMVFGLG